MILLERGLGHFILVYANMNEVIWIFCSNEEPKDYWGEITCAVLKCQVGCSKISQLNKIEQLIKYRVCFIFLEETEQTNRTHTWK